MIGRQWARHRAGESRLFSASERGFTEKVLLDWGNFVGTNPESPIQIFYQHNTIGLVSCAAGFAGAGGFQIVAYDHRFRDLPHGLASLLALPLHEPVGFVLP